MIARRDLALAAALYLSGAFSTLLIFVLLSTNGKQTTIFQPVSLRRHAAHPSFTLAYAVPKTLYTGEATVIHATVRNEGVRFQNTRTHASLPTWMNLILGTSGRCTAVADGGTVQRFPAPGASVSFAWHLTGMDAGTCKLAFRSSLPNAHMHLQKTALLLISAPSAPVRLVPLFGGVIGLIGLSWATWILLSLGAVPETTWYGTRRSAPVRRAICAPLYTHPENTPTLAPALLRWWDRERNSS